MEDDLSIIELSLITKLINFFDKNTFGVPSFANLNIYCVPKNDISVRSIPVARLSTDDGEF